MGWTVLYIAFGIVALWLLGEVLLQYKARLRWRLLAFTGFMGVVLGVLVPSVFVIAVGTIAFAIGQTYVTLSFRRGFSTGWAIGGRPGASRRRRPGGKAADREPALEVSDLEYEPVTSAAETTAAYEAAPSAAETSPVYEPEPMPDETGQYGVYNDAAQDARTPGQPHHSGTNEYGGGYGTYPYEQPVGQGTYGAQDAYSGQGTYADQGGYTGQDDYAAQYDYGNGQQQYAAYSDPYVGSANSGQQYGSYDSFGGQQQYADPYGGQEQYGNDTPPGGVWVPQQRDRDGDQPQPPGYDPGYNDQQYRY
ncbi:hypothetical protein [Streptomyces sp. NPDC088400]|uniref:hypothetical protein n=1 Tax=Streptomyces sp. NPDC088400 TaxID=3365861 RepID=UPI00381EB5AA